MEWWVFGLLTSHVNSSFIPNVDVLASISSLGQHTITLLQNNWSNWPKQWLVCFWCDTTYTYPDLMVSGQPENISWPNTTNRASSSSWSCGLLCPFYHQLEPVIPLFHSLFTSQFPFSIPITPKCKSILATTSPDCYVNNGCMPLLSKTARVHFWHDHLPHPLEDQLQLEPKTSLLTDAWH